MIIELDVTWTFPTPPTTTPYGVDIYYRLVGTTTYSTLSVSNGESGSATITLVTSTEDTISDRAVSCQLEYEGYVVPTCAANAEDQRTPFTTVASDVTDYMQCRGVQAECTAGAIIAIIPDPDPSLIFTTDPLSPPQIDASSFSGSGSSGLLPGIIIVWTNPSASSSTIKQIILSGYNPSGGFDSTTTFDIIGLADDKTTPVTMTPTIVTACGSTQLDAKSCYNGSVMPRPFFSTDNGIAKTCVDNVNTDDYNTTFSGVGTVNITEDYLCCQKIECVIYQITWNGVTIMPWMTSFQFGYINHNNGQLIFNNISSSSGTQFISAIKDTIQVYGNQTDGFDFAAFLILGGVTITEIGPCP
jgi:hypothetical protein